MWLIFGGMDLKRGLGVCVLSGLLVGCQTAPKIKVPTTIEVQLCQTLLNNAANSLNDVAKTNVRAQNHYNSLQYDRAIEELEYASNFFERSKENIKTIEQQEACGQVEMRVPYIEGTYTFDKFKKDIYDRASLNSRDIVAVKKVKCQYSFSQVLPVMDMAEPLVDVANFREGMGFFESAILARREISGMFLTATDTLERIQRDEDCVGAPLQLIVNHAPVTVGNFKKQIFSSWSTNGYRVHQLKAKLR